MILAEFSRQAEMAGLFYPYESFVYAVQFTYPGFASFWTTTFGAPDEAQNISYFINSFTEDLFNEYAQTDSVSNCVDNEKTFFWDSDSGILYVHFIHTTNTSGEVALLYGQAFGYSNKNLIYVDGVCYEPLLVSIPSIAQQQDLFQYDLLAFINGNIELINTEGVLDFFIDEDFYGTYVRLYFAEDSFSDYTRSDLTSLAAFYIEDFSFSLSKIIVAVQDIRKSQNKSVPDETFLVADYPDIEDKYKNNIIPLIYGQPRYSTAIPVDGGDSGDVTFRQALTLTSLGTVQTYQDEIWTTVTPTSTDLTTGSFTLAYADCRKGGATGGAVLSCRVADSVGIAVTYASDIIKDLNERFLNIEYNTGNYDITEWEAEEVSLSPIAIVFNKQIKLYESIKQVQSSANVGFRYEVNATGKRTIRIDDNDRAQAGIVSNVDIKDSLDLTVDSNSDLLAAIIKVKYDKDFNSNRFLSYTDDSNSETVRIKYRQEPTIETEILCLEEADAIEKATWIAERTTTIPRILSVTLQGTDWFSLRIYDIFKIEITPSFVDLDLETITGREYFGVWKCKVLSVSPDFVNNTNTVGFLLVEKEF
jgi:hypothetical protein